jgi:hypothetical protein
MDSFNGPLDGEVPHMKTIIGRIFLSQPDVTIETEGREVLIIMPGRRIALPQEKAELLADLLLLAAEKVEKDRFRCPIKEGAA